MATKVTIEHLGDRSEILVDGEHEDIAYLCVKAASGIYTDSPSSLDWIEASVHNACDRVDFMRVGLADVLSLMLKAWTASSDIDECVKIQIDAAKLTEGAYSHDDKANLRRLRKAVALAKWDCTIINDSEVDLSHGKDASTSTDMA